jgi:hypothetical protein
MGYRANLWLRSAIRVLRLLHETLLDGERPSGEEVRRRQGYYKKWQGHFK